MEYSGEPKEKIERSKKHIIRKSIKLKYLILLKNYDKARDLAENLIENYEIDDEQRGILQSQLVTILTKQEKYEEAKNIAEELLNSPKVQGKQRDIIQNQLDKIVNRKNYIDEPETENLPNKNRNIVKNIRYESFCNGIVLDNVDLKIIEKSHIANCYYEEKTSKYTRTNLYNGKIEVGELNNLTEENSKTLPGCIFIAESCKYFGLSPLGMKALKGYKMENMNINLIEQKAIAKAIELLKTNTTVPLQEQWNTIYEELDKANKKREDEDYIQ